MPNDKVTLESLRRAPEPQMRERVPLVRFTVDLPDTDHHAFKMFALNSRISMSDGVRALVAILREDGELASRVVRRVRRG